MQPCDRQLHSGPVLDAIDLIELGREWSKTGRLNCRRVHAGAVEGAKLPKIRIRCRRGAPGSIRQHIFQRCKVLFLQLIEAAPPGQVTGDLATLQPATVGVLEKVLTRVTGTVDIRRIDGLALALP
jgi:hypothetical protein